MLLLLWCVLGVQAAPVHVPDVVAEGSEQSAYWTTQTTELVRPNLESPSIMAPRSLQSEDVKEEFSMQPKLSTFDSDLPDDGQDMGPLHEPVKSQNNDEMNTPQQDLLPDHQVSSDLPSLLSVYASKIDEGHGLSVLSGRKHYPRLKKVLTEKGVVDQLVGDGSQPQQQVVKAEPPKTPFSKLPIAPPQGVESLDLSPSTGSDDASEVIIAPLPETAPKSEPQQALESNEPAIEYAFECKTSRKYSGKAFSPQELIKLQADVCADQTAVQWNTKHSLEDSENFLNFVVETANFQDNAIQKAASLGVRMFVLQPFEGCNRRTALCSALNLLQASGLQLKPAVKFWDAKNSLDTMEKNQDLGKWDPEHNMFQLKSAHSEADAIKDFAKWLEQNTVATHPEK